MVTFPVVDFQESPRLLSSLQSLIRVQTDCTLRGGPGGARSEGLGALRAGAARGRWPTWFRGRVVLDARSPPSAWGPIPAPLRGAQQIQDPPVSPAPRPSFFGGGSGRSRNLERPGKTRLF